MKLHQLRFFVAVAEELNFTRAAARVHIEPSPLSRAIKELEVTLGVQLFERDKSHIRLTWCGEVLLEEAKNVLATVEHARDRVTSAANGYRGYLRIGLSDGLAQPRMSEMLAHCREEAPSTAVRIFERTVKQLLEDLRNCHLDAGFTLYPVNEPGFVTEAVWIDQPATVIPARHPLLSHSQVTLQEVARYPVIVCHPEQCLGGHLILEKVFAEANITPNVAEYISGHEPMMMLVSAGYGIGLALESQIKLYNHPGIIVRPLAGEDSHVQTYIVRRDTAISPELEGFIARAKRIGAAA